MAICPPIPGGGVTVIDPTASLPLNGVTVAGLVLETNDFGLLPETLDEGRAEIARGEFVSAEELLHELPRTPR